MKKIDVRASKKYDVIVSRGLLKGCGQYIKSISRCSRAFIVSDENVAPIYLSPVMDSIRQSGIDVSSFVIPPGETSKSTVFLTKILENAAVWGMSRSDIFVSLGGGVVGDITALAASLYMRGADIVALPTTLLAAVDSSVGGKTAVDLKAGKNLMGTFWQPALVLCDCDSFNTLSDDVYADGCAEIIKYALLYDKRLFKFLETESVRDNEEKIVARCVELKRDVIERDERDNGERIKLNLGHTFGHAIEVCSGYEISHGKAVSVGMVMAARFACSVGLCRRSFVDELMSVLLRYSLPVQTSFNAADLASAALNDKKRNGDRIALVLPRSAGDCVLYTARIDDLTEVFRLAEG